MKPTVADNVVYVDIKGERIAVWCGSREEADRVADALYREMQAPGFAWLVCMCGGRQAVHMALTSLRTSMRRRASRGFLTRVRGAVELTFGPHVLDKLTVRRDGTVEMSTPPLRSVYERLASTELVEMFCPPTEVT